MPRFESSPQVLWNKNIIHKQYSVKQASLWLARFCASGPAPSLDIDIFFLLLTPNKNKWGKKIETKKKDCIELDWTKRIKEKKGKNINKEKKKIFLAIDTSTWEKQWHKKKKREKEKKRKREKEKIISAVHTNTKLVTLKLRDGGWTSPCF